MNYNIDVTNFKNGNSELSINKMSVKFEKRIRKYRQFEHGIIVMIAEDDEKAKNFSSSVFCYDFKGELVWQMQKPSEVGKPNGHLVDMRFDETDDSKLIVFEFMGNRYFLNMKNGEIVYSDISEW